MQLPAMDLERRYAEEPRIVRFASPDYCIRQDPRVDAVGLEHIRHFLLGFLEAKGVRICLVS